MPYDINGNYTLPVGYKVANGQKVLPSQHNPPFEDIKAAISTVVIADGRRVMSGDLNMGGNKVTGVAEGTDPSDVATVGQAASAIGDGKWSLSDLGENWLRRDGSLYDVADYPDLAALLPTLPDGVNWESILAGLTGSLRDIKQVTGGYMAMSVSGSDTLVWKSADAENWSQIGTIASFSIETFTTGAGIYVACDGNGFTAVSNDGITWSKSGGATVPTGASGIAFGAGVFVVCGVGGVIKTSPDGVSWTSRTSGVSTQLLDAKFINSIFMVVGASGVILTSPDGTTWTARTSGTTQSLYGSAYGAGVYVAVGANGTILSSANLTSWTARTSGTTQQLNDVTYSTSGFVAVGGSGVARISGDGITWASTPTGVGTAFQAITYDLAAQQKYYVVGGATLLRGIRTLPTQFRVPDDGDNEWVRAL